MITIKLTISNKNSSSSSLPSKVIVENNSVTLNVMQNMIGLSCNHPMMCMKKLDFQKVIAMDI